MSLWNENLIGKKINNLTILYKDDSKDKDGSFKVVCQCDCGKKKSINLSRVLKGKVESCGCIRYLERRKNIIGKRFDNIVVEKMIGARENKSIFLLKCDCGNRIKRSFSEINSGVVKNCGCKRYKYSGKTRGRYRKIYTIYQNMMSRCYNKNNIYYENYGGRGIKVCDRWKDDYLNFLDDIEKSIGLPNNNDTIDRINNNKGYSLENINWTDMTHQNSNKRSKYFGTDMMNIYKRPNGAYRVKISRYGKTIQSHSIHDLERAKKLRDFYIEFFNGDKSECIKKYNEQCYLKK